MKQRDWVILIAAFATMCIILAAVFLKLSLQTTLYLGMFLIIGLAAPYLIASYIKYIKSRRIEQKFPDFLRDITESIRAGMTIPKAIENSTKTNYGELSNWIRKMNYMISWGVPFPEALKTMKEGVKHAPYVSRGLSIILQSYYSGGDIASTMHSIAQATNQLQNVEKDRESILQEQVIIVYVIHFLFLAIIIAMYNVLIPMISTQPTEGGFISFGTPPSYGYFKNLFLMTIVIQSFANALVAGETREGNLTAGIKHLTIMLPISVIAYLLFVFPAKFEINTSISKTELLPGQGFELTGNVRYEGEMLAEVQITAVLANLTYQTVTDEKGEFNIELTAPENPGVYEVVISATHEQNSKKILEEVYVS